MFYGRVTYETGVFASGDSSGDWIYVHYHVRPGHKEGERRLKRKHKPDIITLKRDIKLINYGCYGNVPDNRNKFDGALRESDNYLGKYNGKSSDRIVFLDLINDLEDRRQRIKTRLEAIKKCISRCIKRVWIYYNK
jgi:hypothetical protein